MTTRHELYMHGRTYIAQVHHYSRPCPMRVTGSGFGDAEPQVEEEIDFDLFDANGQAIECAITLTCAEMRLLDIYRK